MKQTETIENLYKRLKQILDRAAALQTSLAFLEWDNETLAPEEAGEQTARTAGILSGLYYGIMTGEELGNLLTEWDQVSKNQEREDPTGKEPADKDQEKEDREPDLMEQMKKEGEKERQLLICIPRNEYEEFARLTSSSGRAWAKAKEEKDFSIFAPVLEEILEYKKRIAAYRKKEGQTLYDAMLMEFEESFPEEKLDGFFQTIREELVPFLKKIQNEGKKIDNRFLYGDYPEEKQEQLARMMAEYLGFDFKRGVMAVSAHPFTTSFHNKDVRITTHYDKWLDHSLFSVIHETGHALYELGIDGILTQTVLGQGASMAMHESQSRFLENVIGRSQAFWTPIYGSVQNLFPEQLGALSLDEFVAAVNQVKPGLIRTNADELTYSLHIMIRYELEKKLVRGEIQVKDLEQIWADQYEEYLGIRPKDPSEGVLQDIHWSQGSFGYFPSYALGSAFAAQIYEAMKQTMDVDGLLKAGNIQAVTEYLRENIHCYGKRKDSARLLKDVTGKELDPQDYIHYLKEKYSRLYFEKESL